MASLPVCAWRSAPARGPRAQWRRANPRGALGPAGQIGGCNVVRSAGRVFPHCRCPMRSAFCQRWTCVAEHLRSKYKDMHAAGGQLARSSAWSAVRCICAATHMVSSTACRARGELCAEHVRSAYARMRAVGGQLARSSVGSAVRCTQYVVIEQISSTCRADVEQMSSSCRAVVDQLSSSCRAVVEQLSRSFRAIAR